MTLGSPLGRRPNVIWEGQHAADEGGVRGVLASYGRVARSYALLPLEVESRALVDKVLDISFFRGTPAKRASRRVVLADLCDAGGSPEASGGGTEQLPGLGILTCPQQPGPLSP